MRRLEGRRSRAGEKYSIYLFFFQAEDGIRDTSVTGVQTCALPIFSNWFGITSARQSLVKNCITEITAMLGSGSVCVPVTRTTSIGTAVSGPSAQTVRSEERRVGKGGRGGGWGGV